MVINIENGENAPTGGCGSGGTCSTGTCGNGLEKIYPTAAVRYGYMKSVGEFEYPSADTRFGCGASAIIQTHRGIEMGEMVSLTCDGCDKCVSRDQIREYVKASGPDYYHFDNGKILRLATPADIADWEHIRAETLHKRAFCQKQADAHNLAMKVLECEHLFGGERIVFYFMAEGRIDFRGLVRGLAEEFQTRIEMRQVGARDEARLLADYETCGRECCCKNFLKTLKPVSMKMAKMQKATLDPAKVSGRCGRLKCCLRYEHTTYEELNKKLPAVGKRVFTVDGAGTVVARQILTQLVQIVTHDGGRLTVPVEALIDEQEATRLQAAKTTVTPAPPPRKAEAAAPKAKEDDPSRRARPQRPRRPRRNEATGEMSPPEVKGGLNKDAEERPTEAKRSPPKAERQKPPAGEPSGGDDVSRPRVEGEGGESESAEGGKNRKRRRGRRPSRKRGPRPSEGENNSSPPAS